ncbi:MAG TPA: geranylgeranylglycerol-phosphate geranylgeranyltransferase [Flavobacterium sp.]|jgi:4-hydroxybenzoate polyprenyltransferase
MDFLRVIRFQNLLMLAFMQLVFRFGFLEQQAIPLALSRFQFALLVLATVFIAAGGYLINNIFDVATDLDNKPQNVVIGKGISENAAYNYYVALNVIGVGLGFYLSNYIGKPGYSAVFIVIAGLLYLYASSLKQSLLIGNIIVAATLSVSVLIIGVYDLMPVLTTDNQVHLGIIFKVLLDYAIFAFIINFIREVVKDLEDVNGDYNNGMNTLPIALGVGRTTQIMFFLSWLPIILLLWYINEYYVANNLFISVGYMLFLVIGPLLYFTIKLWSAKGQKDFKHLSTVLKVVLFLGILSIYVVTQDIANA